MSTPWLKFYPSDWRADPALRMCSVGARGLWMEMLCVMHEAVPRGHLLVNGRPVNERQLAALAGCSLEEVERLLEELEAAGVFSRDAAGNIFSRRMQRDDEKAARDKANGKAGGNPLLKGHKAGVNPPDKPPVMGEDKAQKPEARVQKEEPPEPPSEVQTPRPALIVPGALAQALDAFNDTARAAGWPQVRNLTASRRAALNQRLAECGGLDGWRRMMARARASPFLCGENERGWRATFDFLTKAQSFTKLMEGAYDARPSRSTGHAGPGRPSGHDTMLSAMARRFSGGAPGSSPDDPGAVSAEPGPDGVYRVGTGDA